MPKEQIRKRGRRKPKVEDEYDTRKPEEVPAPATEQVPTPTEEQPAQAGPSGLHPDRLALLASGGRRPPPPHFEKREGEQGGEGGEGQQEQQQQPWGRQFGLVEEFPFGELDPDKKGFVKAAEDQIKMWEGGPSDSAGETRQERQGYLTNLLLDVRGQELKLATDPDTALFLERLLPSLGDWGRRVIGDAFGNQWELLLKHRFGSHVVQTWLTLGADTLDREERGIYPPQQEEQDTRIAEAGEGAEEGVLPKMTDLFKSLIENITPNLGYMLANPFASPPVRLLWLIISPGRALPTLDSTDEGIIRSKKSNKYRKGQGVQGKSIFGEEKGKGRSKELEGGRKCEKSLCKLRKAMRKSLMEKLNGGEWRMLGVNAVGCPTVQLLLEFEVEDGHAERENSILDHLTEGLITSQKQFTPYEPQPYPISLLTTSTGTRLFESMLLSSPEKVFAAIWSTYFEGKIGKLAIHPMSNFVVAKAIERLSKEGVERVVTECKAVSGGRGMIKSARTSVLQALVDRAGKIEDCQLTVLSLIQSSIALAEDQIKFLVPCVMTLNTYPNYQAILSGEEVPEEENELPADAVDQKAEDEATAIAKRMAWENRRKPKAAAGDLEPNIQGCLLLQALAQLPVANEVVLQTLIDQDTKTIFAYATHPVASRFLDIAYTTPAAPIKLRRQIINILIPQLYDLIDDRIGSRVAEKVWESSDGYTKEKIARTLMPNAHSLRLHQYGRHLYPRLQVELLQRKPAEWRAAVLGVQHHFAHQRAGRKAPVVAEAGAGEEEKKRKGDEIDELFAEVESKSKKIKA